MGFHSYLQQNGIPFESALARSANLRMFRQLRRAADAVDVDRYAEPGGLVGEVFPGSGAAIVPAVRGDDDRLLRIAHGVSHRLIPH